MKLLIIVNHKIHVESDFYKDEEEKERARILYFVNNYNLRYKIRLTLPCSIKMQIFNS